MEEDMGEVTEEYPLVDKKSCNSSPIDNPDESLNQKVSVQDVLDDVGFNSVSVAYLVTLGFIVFFESLHTGYIAIIIPYLTCEWDLAPSQQALVFSLTFGASGLGAVVIGVISDRYGRKPTAFGTCIIQLLSLIISSFSHNFVFYTVSLSMVGFSAGGSISIAFTYWAEVSSLASRATGVLIITSFWNSGIVAANAIALLSVNSLGWRLYTCFVALPVLIPVITLPFLAESPKYLDRINDVKQMRISLRKIIGRSNLRYDINEVTITEGTSKIDVSLKESFAVICDKDLRCETLRVVSIYSCLQSCYKGLALIFVTCLTADYCGMKMVSSNNDTNVEGANEPCKRMSDRDYINGMFTAMVLFISVFVTIYLTKRIKEIWTMKILSLSAIFFNFLLLFCLPKLMMYISFGMILFTLNGISVVFYIILPKLYPTIARNSGFGLVDGISKIVASVFTFFITILLNHSIKGSIGAAMPFIAVILIQLFAPGLENKLKASEECTNLGQVSK